MTDTAESARPVPRWLHAWAVLVVVATFLLLALGQMVTSFRAGMADPIWPTEPWYLFSNYKLDLGYLIEHSHRILAWSIGLFVSVLGVGLWCVQPRSRILWVGLAGLLVMLAGFLMFHGELGAQRNKPAAEMQWPMMSSVVTLLGLVVALGSMAIGMVAGVRGSGLRLLGMVALVCVMIQGLLGGFRVKLNELVGTDLAAVHGVFAQVVFGIVVTLAVLTARPANANRPSRSLSGWATLLAGLLFVQVVWGAMVRHDPTPLTQKLHFLTAFLATAVAVWVLHSLFADRAARKRTGIAGWLLCGLLVTQLYLGVEAWMEKFGTYTLPELVPITKENATIRTLHALVGSGLLATAVGLAVRLRASSCARIPEDERKSEELARPSSSHADHPDTLALSHSAGTRGDTI
jgi:heme a synthase